MSNDKENTLKQLLIKEYGLSVAEAEKKAIAIVQAFLHLFKNCPEPLEDDF
jgi:hypothetical protein